MEGEEVTIFIVLSVVDEGDNGRLILLLARVIGMFEICFDVIANANRIYEVLVIFSDLYRYFS